MTSAPAVPAQQLAIRHALFQLGHRNLRAHVLGQMSLPMLVAAGTWASASHTLVLAWTLFMQGCAAMLYGAVWAFRHQAASATPDTAALRKWHAANFAMLSVVGLGWGGLGLLFVADAGVSNLVVMTSFAGALAYSAVSNVYDLRAFYASVLFGTVALISQVPSAFGAQAPSVIGMCLLYLVVLVQIARSTHKTLIESIQLRLDNEQLARTNAAHAARAEKANRDKSEFLAAASHDLRQPVHALMLLIEAYRQSEPRAANHPLIQQIAAAGASVRSLFNALMELSRLDSGSERVTREPVDLSALLRSTFDALRPQAERKGLHLRLRIARAGADALLYTDRLLLERILSNLLSNAVRHTASGGVLLALRAAHADGVHPGGGLWLEVWDSGAGIAVQDQERIFEPYVQIGNQERDRSKGLGLGLAIVRRAAALLELELTLHSRVGRGSCFRLHLPAGTAMPMARLAEDTLAEPARQVTAGALRGRRILLIDDEPMVRQAMQALLGGWQLDLRCASSGSLAAALEVCGPHWAPDCIISDHRLPGELHGIALLDALLEQFPQAVGLLQTGELVQNVQAQAEDAGYVVLFKPVAPAMLATTLCAVLEPGSREAPAAVQAMAA